MFIPVGKLIIALVWAFWIMGVDSSLGRDHLEKQRQIKEILKIGEIESPEYFPTYSSTFDKETDRGIVNCGIKDDFKRFSESYWD